MAGRQYADRYSLKRAGDNYVCLYFDRSGRTINTAASLWTRLGSLDAGLCLLAA